MTLQQILDSAAAFLGTTSSDLIVNNVHLGLMALNQSRTMAVMSHDFEFTRTLAEVTVDSEAGRSLNELVRFGTTLPVEAKTIVEVGAVLDGQLVPVDWTTVAESIERQRFAIPDRCSRVVFSGNRVFVYPWNGQPTRLWLEIYENPQPWDYPDLPNEHAPWTTYGQQFMLWQTVVILNHLKKEFVFRQEGNLQPPEQLAQAGLELFKQWDIFRYEQFRRHARE